MRKLTVFLALVPLMMSCTTTEINNKSSKELVGEWERLDTNYGNTIITEDMILLDSNMACNYYVIEAGLIRVQRLFLDEDNPAFDDTCKFWFTHDTLTITAMQMSPAAIYPPTFYDIILKKLAHIKYFY